MKDTLRRARREGRQLPCPAPCPGAPWPCRALPLPRWGQHRLVGPRAGRRSRVPRPRGKEGRRCCYLLPLCRDPSRWGFALPVSIQSLGFCVIHPGKKAAAFFFFLFNRSEDGLAFKGWFPRLLATTGPLQTWMQSFYIQSRLPVSRTSSAEFPKPVLGCPGDLGSLEKQTRASDSGVHFFDLAGV